MVTKSLFDLATFYAKTESTNMIDPNQLIRDLRLSDIQSEEMNPCAIDYN